MIKQHDVGRWFSVRTVTMIIIMLLFSVDVTRGYLPYAVNHHLRDTFAVLPFMQTNAFYMKAIEFAVLCFFQTLPLTKNVRCITWFVVGK